jgi:uncharacterized repeat protein (TIGR02543 family)
MKKLITFILLSIGILSFGTFSVYAEDVTYLTFQSTSIFTLNVYDNTKHWDETLYYSTDLETWYEWDGTTTLTSVNNKLYLRGAGNTRITGSDNQNYRWVLTGSNIECVGNIENLLDWETVVSGNHPPMAAYCYAHLFRDCAALTSAPALPATTLTSGCYSHMFQGCTALTSVPALPATTLASDCYNSMFYGCTALTSAPTLPATTLASNCYRSMFHGCTALTSVPVLPATTMADFCYYYMFYGCTSLKVSSTKVGVYQYTWRIPTSGAGIAASNWSVGMLSGTGGTFTGNPDINTTYYVENPPVEDLNAPSGYTITFEENGGTTQTDLTEQTNLPNPLPTPTKSGYTFRGWYYDSDFTSEALAGDPLTGDVTLYAKWSEKNKMSDITILIIGLIIFIIANILGFIYKNNLLTALSGLLWLLPIFLVDNAIIKIFSVIIMLITFLFSFKERDDYYYD